jgi:hypothetical protein
VAGVVRCRDDGTSIPDSVSEEAEARMIGKSKCTVVVIEIVDDVICNIKRLATFDASYHIRYIKPERVAPDSLMMLITLDNSSNTKDICSPSRY